MEKYSPYLNNISHNQERMTSLLENWANINSWSDNLDGLAKMLTALEAAFAPLEGSVQSIPLPPRIKIDSQGQAINVPNGHALRITKRPTAPIRVFLGGHMDTVYGLNTSFQTATRLDNNTLRGPGVADMKGGLVILLNALEAFEKSPFSSELGWEVLINPDEEIGSSGSEHLFIEAAKRNHIGLLFEPAFPDGSIVTSRKGSANFTLVAKGRAAHAGRDFHAGRNAISAVVRFIASAEALNNPEKGTTINIGYIEGGGPVNIVPDLAICRFNVRMVDPDELPFLREKLHQAVAVSHEFEGISLVLYETVARIPKPFDQKNMYLFSQLQACGKELGCGFEGRSSGGVCDGNILSAAGLPTIDTLGVIGGNIHTIDEYALLDSLTERTSLVTYFLMRLANGEIDINKFKELVTS